MFSSSESDPDSECTLIKGMFAKVLQGVLGIIAFGVLILKRYLDPHPRRLRIWLMDSAKQVVSAGCAHF